MNDLVGDLSQMGVFPRRILSEIVELTGRDDERMWIPEASPGCWWRPLMFDLANGHHVELFKVRKGGVLSRHLHPTPVHGFVISGRWRYLEHDWVAEPGAYVYEPPGDVHTLVCDDAEEMLTLFHINGPIVYLDEQDNVTCVDDNNSIMARARAHYAQVGLGAEWIDRLCR